MPAGDVHRHHVVGLRHDRRDPEAVAPVAQQRQDHAAGEQGAQSEARSSHQYARDTDDAVNVVISNNW